MQMINSKRLFLSGLLSLLTATSACSSSKAGADDDGASGTGESTTPDIDPNDLFSDITFAPHPKVATMLVVDWTQQVASDTTRLQFTFDDEEWFDSPDRPGETGAHREVILGVPEGVELSFRVVAGLGGGEIESEVLTTTNGEAPAAMPRPTIEAYLPELTSGHRFMLGAVSEKGDGGYGGPHWIYIIDRLGRVVWYHRPGGGPGAAYNQSFWPRPSRDGTHISFDRQLRQQGGYLLFTTLDFEYQREVELPGQNDCYDVTTDGSVLYDSDRSLVEIAPDGTKRTLWTCESQGCYANAVNYDPESDTVLMSFPYWNTVIQFDRKTGNVKNMWGDLGDWTFEPANMGLDFNHWATISPDGTFMVSSHLPGTETHLFMEYTIDETTKTLRTKWTYGEGKTDWAPERGMTARVEGGNSLGNYGPTGVIVEVTPEQELGWRVNFHDRLLGNNFLVDDLYALNRGPQGG